MNASCSERTWEALYCPLCDTVVTAAPGKDYKSPTATRPGQTAGGPGQDKEPRLPPVSEWEGIAEDPQKIQALNQEIERFVSVILSVNDGRPFPQAERYFTKIRQLQVEMVTLQANAEAQRQAKVAQPPPAAAPKAAPPPPAAAETPPRPPVDWNELARKLIEEIGRQPVDRAPR